MSAIVIGLRHAPVENPGNLVYATLPGYHLSAAGLAAATSLGQDLAGRPLVAVYASPLERAQETARALGQPHGIPVTTDGRLIEWSFWSRWEGTPWATLREKDPETFERYLSDPGSLHPTDPLVAVGERIVAWAREAGAKHGEGLVIGVSHEAPLAAACVVARGGSMEEFPSVQVNHLGAVRFQPAPVEVVDPRAPG